MAVEVFHRNYLAQVTAAVQFVPGLNELGLLAMPDEFIAQMRVKYPRVQRRDKQSGRVVLDLEDSSLAESGNLRNGATWRFVSADEQRFIEIADDRLLFSVKDFIDPDSFTRDFMNPISALNALLKSDLSFNRVGLRALNRYDLDEWDAPWSDYLAEPLFCALSIPTAEEALGLARVMSVVELNLEDIRLRMQYGLPNPDYPSSSKRNLFVLDFDAYVRSTVPYGDLEALFWRLHDTVYSFFERCLRPKLRAWMNEEELDA